MSTDFDSIRNLPLADKLRLVEQLWDEIATSSEPFPLQAWHVEEAEERSRELEQHPEIAITREELWRRVNKGDEA